MNHILKPIAIVFILAVIQGCGPKKNEVEEFERMQKRSDSVYKQEVLDKKGKNLDSLAGSLDSMKKDLEKMQRERDSIQKQLDKMK